MSTHMFLWINKKIIIWMTSLIWTYVLFNVSGKCNINPCHAEPGYTLPLQTV